MIRGVLIKENKVVNVAIFKTKDDLIDGWVESLGGEGPGWNGNQDGSFSPPHKPVGKPPTAQERVVQLLNSISIDDLRGAAIGRKDSIDHIQSIKEQVTALEGAS